VAPLPRRGIDDLARPVDIFRLIARCRVWYEHAIGEAEAVARSMARERRGQLVPPLARGSHFQWRGLTIQHQLDPIARGRPEAKLYGLRHGARHHRISDSGGIGSASSTNSSSDRPVMVYTAPIENGMLSWHSALVVSMRSCHEHAPAHSGSLSATESARPLLTIRMVASLPLWRMPVVCARPSSSIPKQRVAGSCQSSSVICTPLGLIHVTSRTPSSSMYSPLRKRLRRRIGYLWRSEQSVRTYSSRR